MSLYANKGFRADRGYKYSEIEFEASVLREVVEPFLKSHERLPGMDLFEKLHRFNVRVGTREVQLDYAVADLPNGLEVLALYDGEHDTIVVALSVETYKALGRGHSRARFALSHELGHAVLHSALLQRMSHIPHRVASLQRGEWSTHASYMDTEWQANAFGGALLMPARGLLVLEQQGLLDIENIACQFSVSPIAAEMRLRVYVGHRDALLAVSA